MKSNASQMIWLPLAAYAILSWSFFAIHQSLTKIYGTTNRDHNKHFYNDLSKLSIVWS